MSHQKNIYTFRKCKKLKLKLRCLKWYEMKFLQTLTYFYE